MTTAVQSMSALAHENRLDLFRRLIKSGPQGMAVGELVEASGLNFSTISAQLLILANADLVGKERQGRSFIYTAKYNSIQGLIAFLMEDCCHGNSQIIQPLAELANEQLCSGANKGKC